MPGTPPEYSFKGTKKKLTDNAYKDDPIKISRLFKVVTFLGFN